MLPGTKVLNGRFEVVKCIHSKGMANVYTVKDCNLGKIWCLKEIIKSDAGKHDIEYVSLLQEAKILRSVSHTGIPRITDTAEDGDSLMIIEDYVEGVTLSKYLQTKGMVQQKIAVQWMKQLCQIIMYLHGLKTPILYRDMKPDNVIIQSDGNIKLLDYGTGVIIYKKGQLPHGYAMGTPGYAAPEQTKKNLPCDLRSDIYGLGMTYYSMLTGLNVSNIPRDSLKDVRVINPSVSVGLALVINKCIQENPDDRYQDCTELLYDLQNFGTLDSEHKSKSKRRVAITAVTFGLAVTMIAGSFIPYFLNRSKAEKEYENAVLVAEQTGRQSDYDIAIGLNPLKLKPYFGYIETMKIDGVFTLEEETALLNHINPNLDKMKGDPSYGHLAFEIGKLYWFYDNSENDMGKVQSIRWFEDAIKEEYEVNTATVYYNLGVFKRDITVSVTEANDAGMYIGYWGNLLAAKESNVGDVVAVQINLAIAECIFNYAYNLKRDGLEYADILKEVDDLESFVSFYNGSDSSVESIRSLYNELKSLVSVLRDKVNLVYGVGGAN